MDARFTDLKHNHTDNNHWENDYQEKAPNFRNQRNLGPQNVDRNLGIKIIIPDHDGKMLLDLWMQQLASGQSCNDDADTRMLISWNVNREAKYEKQKFISGSY